jgi:hypothetical protein
MPEEDIERTVRSTKPDSDWREDDFGHGRIESRHCFLYKDPSFIENAGQWKSLSAVVKIESTRYIKSTGKEEKETRFYITSINRIALNLIKHEQASKRSFRRKHLDAGWNNEYLLKILTN